MEGEIERPPVRALINPNKISQDYDEKIVSVGYEFNFQPGDIFECENRTYIKTDLRLKCVDLSTGEVRDFYGQNTIKIFKKTIDK